MGNEITGIASEFYVLSMLLRKGADATLTLGNKKNIDIFVNKDGKAFTIDVKGLKSTGDFMLAGRSLPLALSSAALFAIWFGSETVFGASSEFLKGGLYSVIEDPFGGALCLVLFGLFFALIN
jgi:hypothetical protein